MKSFKEIKKIAQKTLRLESEAITYIQRYINKDFYSTVSIIYQSKGRVVITGIGKSAIIADKIVATLNSTGTPSLFMHAADAIHGDLGMIRKEDIVICISKSGETPEIKLLVPLLKNAGNKLIAMIGNSDSYLAKQADYVINTFVAKEACPNNLAPTTSTTAQLAMGDALAMCLLECRNFSKEDFARYHTGGILGKKLYLRAADIYVNNPKPKVNTNTDIKEVIMEITSKRLGAAVVVNKNKVVGIITDGDLRRMLKDKKTIGSLTAKEIMSENPKTIEKDTMAVLALQLMKENKITQVIVTDKNKTYLGIVHIHDLLREGLL